MVVVVVVDNGGGGRQWWCSVFFRSFCCTNETGQQIIHTFILLTVAGREGGSGRKGQRSLVS